VLLVLGLVLLAANLRPARAPAPTAAGNGKVYAQLYTPAIGVSAGQRMVEVFRQSGLQDSIWTNPSGRGEQVEGQQPAEERAVVIQALLILATNDPVFLRDVRYAPASTLSRYGLTLRNEEMDGVVSYLIRNADVSDEEILDNLRSHLVERSRWR
jgi:hypothetical protein